MTDEEYKRLTKMGDEAALNLDIEAYRKYMRELTRTSSSYPESRLMVPDEVIESYMRRRICRLRTSTLEQRTEAAEWLIEHGYLSEDDNDEEETED